MIRPTPRQARATAGQISTMARDSFLGSNSMLPKATLGEIGFVTAPFHQTLPGQTMIRQTSIVIAYVMATLRRKNLICVPLEICLSEHAATTREPLDNRVNLKPI
jgi:hypothetical protein|tara:strand:- start:15 stop:329 length:315 start_codon:yes stop_codon:yes gene_type:complete